MVRRYITRPPRANESNQESVHLDRDAFEVKVASGEIAMSWTRPMHGQHSVRYGFGVVPSGRWPIYSGNNALYRNSTSLQPANGLKGALWIGVFAPLEVRRRRIQERSPDLTEAERSFRLSDRGDDIAKHVHLIVHNHGEGEPAMRDAVRDLVATLSSP